MRFKHYIVKEVIIECETDLYCCMGRESFTPMQGETIKSLNQEAKKGGWCIVKGLTCCPQCKSSLDD